MNLKIKQRKMKNRRTADHTNTATEVTLLMNDSVVVFPLIFFYYFSLAVNNTGDDGDCAVGYDIRL